MRGSTEPYPRMILFAIPLFIATLLNDCCFEYSAIETKAHLQNTLFLDAPLTGEGNGRARTGNVFTLVIAS